MSDTKINQDFIETMLRARTNYGVRAKAKIRTRARAKNTIRTRARVRTCARRRTNNIDWRRTEQLLVVLENINFEQLPSDPIYYLKPYN